MPKNLSPTATWSQYVAARSLGTLVTCFDIDSNLQTAAKIGKLMHRYGHRHRQRSHNALRRSFPNWTDEQINATSVAAIQHMAQFAIETMHLPRLMTAGGWSKYVQFRNAGPLLDLLNRKQPVLLVSGHFGNFELLGYILSLLGYPVNAVARPLDNPKIWEWVLSIRQKKGMQILSKWGASETYPVLIENREPLAFVADQNAGDKGYFVPFFGRLASTYRHIGLTAHQFNIPVCIGYANRITRNQFRYEIGVQDIIWPEDWQDQDDAPYYICARFNFALEQCIREHPGQYWWMHRRWKSRPRHEVKGKPMPNSLKDKLWSLPWMTQELFDEVQIPIPREQAR